MVRRLIETYVCGENEANEKHRRSHLAASDGRQALQTGGPWPKQTDVLRLPNRAHF